MTPESPELLLMFWVGLKVLPKSLLAANFISQLPLVSLSDHATKTQLPLVEIDPKLLLNCSLGIKSIFGSHVTPPSWVALTYSFVTAVLTNSWRMMYPFGPLAAMKGSWQLFVSAQTFTLAPQVV